MLYLSDFYALYLIALLGSIIAFIKKEFFWGTILLIYFLGGVIFFLRYGTINKAIKAFNKGKISRVQKLINVIPTDRYMTDETKAYYYFLKGIIFYHQGKNIEANKFLAMAIGMNKLSPSYERLAREIIAKT